jgi:hypothetical protein
LHVVQWHQAVLHAPLEHILQLVIYSPNIQLVCHWHEISCKPPCPHSTQSVRFSNTMKARDALQ